MYTTGDMKLRNYFFSGGGETECRAIAFIRITGEVGRSDLCINSHPLFEWVVKVAKNDEVQPVISCIDPYIISWAREHGYDAIDEEDTITEEEAVGKMISLYSPDVFFLISPEHPILPRGMFRLMKATYLTSEVASISAGKVILFDADVVKKTKQLSPFPSHISLYVPKVCEEEVLEREEGKPLRIREGVDSLFHGVLDPWEEPKDIFVRVGEKKGGEPSPVSGLRVKVISDRYETKTPDGEYDVTFSDLPTESGEETYRLSEFGWMKARSLFHRLSPLAQVISFLCRLYPEAHVTWYGDRTLKRDNELIMAVDRGLPNKKLPNEDYSVEKTFWAQVDDSLKKEEWKDDTSTLKEDGTISLKAISDSWTDILFLNPAQRRGYRSRNKDPFTVITYSPSELKVKWDNWEDETFLRIGDLNLWKRA